MVLKIKTGDEVVVISGKDKGRRGKVTSVVPRKNKLMVEHINITKKHIRPTRKGQQSGIVEREALLSISKVMLICSRCGKKSRVGIKLLKQKTDEGGKLRFCKKCGEVID